MDVRPAALDASIPTVPGSALSCAQVGSSPQASRQSFVSDGFLSLVGSLLRVPVKILRDTGSLDSFVLGSVVLSTCLGPGYRDAG